MAYSRDAFPKDQETSKRLERDRRETRERKDRDGAKPDGLTQTNDIGSKSLQKLERDGAKPDGLTQTNEIASKSQRGIELSLMA